MNLTQACLAYLSSVLLQGLSLSQAIGRTVDLTRGSVSVMPPVDYTSWNERDFRHGGVADWETSKSGLIAHIDRFIKAEGSVGAFEHALAKRSDVATMRELSHLAFFGEEVYFVLDARSSWATLTHGIEFVASALGFVGAFFKLDRGEAELRSALASGNMELLANSLQSLVIGAFDGEGWIWWERVDGSKP